ncbi:MAG: 30S ribosomal protein S9 [Alphaproteobacteria bacterium]|nr:30S ribosomal protein S9 [Alphaproteobacteria bacterium]
MKIKAKNFGMGRRKSASAIVYLIKTLNLKNEISFNINGRTLEKYFQNNLIYLKKILLPFTFISKLENYTILINVKGGGLNAQADAIKLGLARALVLKNPNEFQSILKLNKVLSQDTRIKERRKYGLKKARKASQYSKR